jgi:hypothetical protein
MHSYRAVARGRTRPRQQGTRAHRALLVAANGRPPFRHVATAPGPTRGLGRTQARAFSRFSFFIFAVIIVRFTALR